MSRITDCGYKPAKVPILTDEVTYLATKLAAERSRDFPTTLRAVLREAVKSRYPEEFAVAERRIAAEVVAEVVAETPKQAETEQNETEHEETQENG